MKRHHLWTSFCIFAENLLQIKNALLGDSTHRLKKYFDFFSLLTKKKKKKVKKK